MEIPKLFTTKAIMRRFYPQCMLTRQSGPSYRKIYDLSGDVERIDVLDVRFDVAQNSI